MRKQRRREVVVTGIGQVSPCGTHIEPFWDALVNARSSVGFLSGHYRRHLMVELAAMCTDDLSPWVSRAQSATLDRTAQLALSASIMAMADAKLNLTDEERSRAGIYFGTGPGSASTTDQSVSAAYLDPERKARPLNSSHGLPF